MKQRNQILECSTESENQTEDIQITNYILNELEKLGYPMNDIGTCLYKDMIKKVVEYMQNITEEDNFSAYQQLIFQLKSPYSQFYVDVARNDLDMGITTFHTYVQRAFDKINHTKQKTSNLHVLYKTSLENMDYQEQAFIIGAFIANNFKSSKNNMRKIRKML